MCELVNILSFLFIFQKTPRTNPGKVGVIAMLHLVAMAKEREKGNVN